MNAFSNLKSWIRNHPRLFDKLKLVKRKVGWQADPVYEFFDTLSRNSSKPIRFVQIGAADGLRNDPIREFVIRDNWAGTLIEPLPEVFEILKNNYAKCSSLEFINAAVSSEVSTSKIWTFDSSFLSNFTYEKQLDYLRKASFDQKHLVKLLDKNWRSAEVLKEITIECLDIKKLLEDRSKQGPIDLLVIDAEGHEFEIISGIGSSPYLPKVIFYESHNLGRRKHETEICLRRMGYLVRDIIGDSVAIR